MSTSHSKDYWIISAFMFTLFVAYSFVYAMYAIWLSQAVDLSGEKIGIIFSFNAVAAIVSQPLLGFIQDKIQARQHILWLNVITLIAAGPFLNLVYKPLLLSDFYLGVVVGSAYIALAFLAIAGAVETYIERISRFNHLEYGQIRTWGSLGWATAAFFTGRLINIDVDLNFWMASVISLIPLFILVVIKIPVSEKAAQAFSVADKITVKDIVGVLKLRNFQYLTLFVFGVAAIYVVYDQQFPVYFAAVFPTVEEGNKMYGYLNSAQIFLEAGGFFVAPWLINKIGPKNGLLLAGAIIVVRIASSGLTDSPLLISLIKLMHAAELPILMVAMFKYLNKHFDSHLSSTLYILGFTFVTQVGTVTLSPLAGIYYDTIGFEKTYFIMAGISGFFLLISTKLLFSDSAHVAVDPVADIEIDDDEPRQISTN